MSLMKDARKMVKDRPFLVLAAAGTVGYYAYLKQMQLAVEASVDRATQDNSADIPLIFSESAGINGMGMNSGLGMTTSTSTTTSSSHMPSLRDDSAGEPSIHIPAGSGLFGAKKKFSQVGGSARRRLGSVAREPSPVYGAHIDTQLSLTSSQKNEFMTDQHSDILGFSGLSAGQSGSWYE